MTRHRLRGGIWLTSSDRIEYALVRRKARLFHEFEGQQVDRLEHPRTSILHRRQEKPVSRRSGNSEVESCIGNSRFGG